MTSKDVGIDVLSTLGAVFWSIQLIPQIYINWKRKTGDGSQPSMMIAWSLAGLPLGIHNILSKQPIALQVQAEILTSLSLLTWAQVMFYDHKWSIKKCVCTLSVLAAFFAAIQCAFVFGFRYGDTSEKDKQRTILAMAILAALGLSFGVLRHYYDIYLHKTVRGIAWAFVALDAAGDLTSLLAVTIKSPADRIAAGIYASELGLWIGIILAGLVINARYYIQARRQIIPSNDLPEINDAREEVAQENQLERQSSVSSAFSRIIPNTQMGSSWLMRRTRRQQQVA
ncbi:uncharacterized protein FA14DRAFT_159295 [Meira miltonrushii]|uniref:PQ-loop-domain-containing protein n=1 Tax=Meira miltonrushii TaxID=1280837 RepID=A0A316VLW0_9BASI|nr:uncharacterized protein FA14DRAFT_159295 [Meira miltonrushii]PWN37091.1 hypothetical protein FA14DRAFT_159295 [Meira miltonrushii]